MVGRRGEAPLVPPYSFRRPNKAMALRLSCVGASSLTLRVDVSGTGLLARLILGT